MWISRYLELASIQSLIIMNRLPLTPLFLRSKNGKAPSAINWKKIQEILLFCKKRNLFILERFENPGNCRGQRNQKEELETDAQINFHHFRWWRKKSSFLLSQLTSDLFFLLSQLSFFLSLSLLLPHCHILLSTLFHLS